MILRDYQERAIAECREALAPRPRGHGWKAVCLVSPTGSGKTRCATEMIRLGNQRGTRSMFIAPRVELVDQCARQLEREGIVPHVIQGRRGRDVPTDAECYVASIPTLTADLSKIPVDISLVIIDECHGAMARTRRDLLEKYPLAKLIGLTATPQRGDGQNLGVMFDGLVVTTSVAELTKQGHLVPVRVYAPAEPMGHAQLAQDPVDAYETKCAGRRCVVFATSIEEGARIAQRFCERGHRAAFVSGTSSNRTDLLAAYADDDLRVIVNVNILVEGWDDPSTSALIFARRFSHVGSYLQACGRALRTAPGKTDAVVVDLVGSALEHGTPDMEREYALDGDGIVRIAEASLRTCIKCGGVHRSGPPTCPFCGGELRMTQRAHMRAVNAELVEMRKAERNAAWRPIRAKKRGLCSGCGGETKPGDWILWRSGHAAQHVKCANRGAA